MLKTDALTTLLPYFDRTTQQVARPLFCLPRVVTTVSSIPYHFKRHVHFQTLLLPWPSMAEGLNVLPVAH
jgi:hypothetical protein